MDYKLVGRTTLPAHVDRCVVLANLSASCFLVPNHAQIHTQIQSTPGLFVGRAGIEARDIGAEMYYEYLNLHSNSPFRPQGAWQNSPQRSTSDLPLV